jgi:hypothetical protein
MNTSFLATSYPELNVVICFVVWAMLVFIAFVYSVLVFLFWVLRVGARSRQTFRTIAIVALIVAGPFPLLCILLDNSENRWRGEFLWIAVGSLVPTVFGILGFWLSRPTKSKKHRRHGVADAR